MGPDGPTRPHDSTAPRDVLDLLLLNPFLPDHRQAEQSDSGPDQLAEPPEQREGDAGYGYDLPCLRKSAAMAEFCCLPLGDSEHRSHKRWVGNLGLHPFSSRNVSAAAISLTL